MRELRWVQILLTEFGVGGSTPRLILQENLGSVSWTSQVKGLRNVKHVNVKYHYVRGSLEQNRSEVCYTPMAENLADPLAKVLVGQTFEKLRAGTIFKSISETF